MTTPDPSTEPVRQSPPRPAAPSGSAAAPAPASAPDPGTAGPPPSGWGEAPTAPPGYGTPQRHQGDGRPQNGGQQYGGQQYGGPAYGGQQYGGQQQGPAYGGQQYGGPGYGGSQQYGSQQYGGQQQGPTYGGQQSGGQQQGPTYGGQQYGGQQYGPAAPPPGMAPIADKPGIVPLRPLRLGEIFDGAFGAVRSNPRVMLGVPAIVLVACTAVSVVLSMLLVGVLSSLGADLTAELGDAGMGSGFFTGIMTLWVQAVVVQVLALPIINGLLSGAVGDAVVGRRPTLAQVWSAKKGRLARLVGYSALLLLVTFAAMSLAAAAVLVLVLVAVDGGLSVAATVVLCLTILAAVVVGALWLQTKLILAPPALVLERQGVWRSVARSWRLTRGVFWRVLGTWLLATILVGIISGIVTYPFSIVATLFAEGSAFAFTSLTLLGSIVAGMITTLFMATIVALLYVDVRMRREGLDIELAAAARRDAQRR
ncbi:hypothetical protein GCM10025865_22040 [Paraoerskovia sediminicola]|uniref:DUF7847 domain-containing protein n=1 Tax=Paraoerskovia sediminicola TaxID=1138587 RepID=A0ABM8G492_9CELL|nr:glycerophosphoryl diester phosphodiesterase membrane domain-containing protein [Paraoerskovia sediminicola]BDZ42905.1 hypothetical protein GCM10025865_22040 [Paraoerskovia sediminicola]